ncbi:uncharacterized protein MONOS_10333 [Monocercomonoides exilis]|uniref:uncharacterized protein n=1 Tax=Monocercomonoides exilis TaxID=2049356 RepID=UPI0035598D18|nr:hypothetical protein MONOS_10333 [Monocercomonoides exilis]|eukprot:MONOS_10333.1-p1 / transcript=MONOS_10333.1 / gene=MONOS_10333 / organism=Monocercomonoides_exilis_PA203 / gene_product=unspecified product / transcript_product=unspecified product / location=Mono_scaffold00465:32622-33700(-) / protein_length=141 / sequence_SO=supercontig / SO=protein_coding / is_pseudo=false
MSNSFSFKINPAFIVGIGLIRRDSLSTKRSRLGEDKNSFGYQNRGSVAHGGYLTKCMKSYGNSDIVSIELFIPENCGKETSEAHFYINGVLQDVYLCNFPKNVVLGFHLFGKKSSCRVFGFSKISGFTNPGHRSLQAICW